MHSFMWHCANPGLAVGPYPLKAPSTPVRGYDAPARDALYVPMGFANPVGGAGIVCGAYGRDEPAIPNASPIAVIADVAGAGGRAGVSQAAGGLIDLSALTAFLRGA